MTRFEVDFMFSGDMMDDDGFDKFPVINSDSCILSCPETEIEYHVKLYLRETLGLTHIRINIKNINPIDN